MAKGFTLLTVCLAAQLVAGQYRTSTRRDGFALPDNVPRRRPLPEEYLLEEEPIRTRGQEDDAVRRRQPQTRRQLPPEELLEEPRVSRRRTSAAAAPVPLQPAELPPPSTSQRRSDGSRQSRRQRTRGSGRRRQRQQYQDDALDGAQDDAQALPPQRPVDNSFALDPRLLRQPLVAESPSPSDLGQQLTVDQILGRDTLTLDPPQGQLQPIDASTPQRPTESSTRRPVLPVDLSHGGQPLPADPGLVRSQFQPVDFQAHPRHSVPADPPAPPRRQSAPADPRLQRPADPPPRRQSSAVDTAASRRQLPAEAPSRRQPDPPAPRRPPPPPPPPAQPRRQQAPQQQRPPPAVNVPLPQLDRRCDTPNGFFPDEVQCDRYYECRNGVATEGLCPDGLVFNAGGSRYLNCDSPRVVNCNGRNELQPAQPNGNCPRRYGMFSHESDCTRFWNCLDGYGTEIKCPEGLVYNEERAACDWPDNVPRCNVEEKLDFTCPDSDEGARAGVYERYAHPTDCRLHYVCIPGKDGVNRPRLQSCPDKLVFDNVGGFCEEPRNVEGCEDYYGDSDLPRAEEVRPATDVQTNRRRTRSETTGQE